MKKLTHANNNFDFLRIVGALFIFYSHVFPMLGLHEPIIFGPYKGYKEISFGTLGVSIFFVISGYLITASFLKDPDHKSFFAKRCARIFPAYWGNIIFSVLILGPLVSVLSIKEYFTGIGHIAPQIINSFFGVFDFKIPNLPGVFSENIVKDKVNGSLWTLLPEFVCYFFICMLGVRKLLSKKFFFLVPAMFLLYNILVYPKNSGDLLMLHFCSFSLGAAFYIYSDKIKLSYKYMLLALTIFLVMAILNIYFIPAYLLLTAYVVISFGLLSGKFANISKYGDFSYGIYLYSWPIQQAFAQYYKFDKSMFVYYFISSLTVILILAVISWKLIEAPALNKVRSKLKKAHDIPTDN